MCTSEFITILQKYMHKTMPNKDYENYQAECVNTGASPKYRTAQKPTLKYGYHNKQNNQGRSTPRELVNDSRYNQKRYDNYDNHNHERTANIGIIRVHDGRHDGQRRYNENHDNRNRDRTANIGVIRINDGRHDQRKYDNYDNHNQNRYANARMNQTANNGRYENQKRHDNYENHNRHDIQRRINQSRRDNYNKYDKQDRWENIEDRQVSRQNKASKSESAQRRNWDPIPAHTWRVVCDSMLGGLSSKLRMCGIDCIHVLFDQGGDDSAQLAMRENRILLTRNKSYERVRSALYTLIVDIDLILIISVSLNSIYRWRIATE